jgi:hypothetical protein
VIVKEYQKARYMMALQEEMKNLKYKFKITMNDEFENEGIKKYLNDEIKPVKYADTWLIKIEDQTYFASDMEQFIQSMVEISYGQEGLDRYQKSENARQNFRKQLFSDYMGALLVRTEAKEQNWLTQEDVKNFVSLYINNAKTQYYIKTKLASAVERPSDKEVREYYDQNKNRFRKPFSEIKNMLAQQMFSRKVESKVSRYTEKLLSQKKIIVNEDLFEKKTSDEKEKK